MSEIEDSFDIKNFDDYEKKPDNIILKSAKHVDNLKNGTIGASVVVDAHIYHILKKELTETKEENDMLINTVTVLRNAFPEVREFLALAMKKAKAE